MRNVILLNIALFDYTLCSYKDLLLDIRQLPIYSYVYTYINTNHLINAYDTVLSAAGSLSGS